MGSLQSRIKELESAASKQAQAERADDTRLKELILGLKADNAELTATVKTFERELGDKIQLEGMVVSSRNINNPNALGTTDVKSTMISKTDSSSPVAISLISELNEKVENLRDQINGLNERLKKAEQAKEHWKLEYQLVQMKYDKQRVKLEGIK